MRAVLLTGHGGLDQLQYSENVETPIIESGEALVRVKACGLNNTDINTRTAWYSKAVEEGITQEVGTEGFDTTESSDGSWGNSTLSFPIIQGADVCGIVEDVYGELNSTLIGQRVLIDPWFLDQNNPNDLSKAKYFGSEINGGYAEFTKAPLINIHPINSRYSDAELATFACAYSTAENLINRTQLQSNETIVISGASGGVGSAAIQLAKVRGARVIALSSKDKTQSLIELGADSVIDRNQPQLASEIKKQAEGEVDVAVDVVGGEIFNVLVDCLRQGGRYSSSGCITGPIVDFDLRKLIYRDLQFTGATVVPQGTFARIVHYIESEQLKPILADSYPLKELATAQTAFMKKTFTGNIVVTV